MEDQSYLIFRLNELSYGIEATQVQEVFQLPELKLIHEAPGDIIGTLNYRGKVLPVMHLARRLHQPIPPCRLSDSVIVVNAHGIQAGVVVNQVYDVQSFGAEALEPEPDYGRDHHINTAFVAGIAKIDSDLITVINPDTLIRQADEVALLGGEGQLSQEASSHPSEEITRSNRADTISIQYDGNGVDTTLVLTNFFDLYCPEATRSDQRIFRQRAQDLRSRLETSDSKDLMPLAVIGLGEEYFGVELGLVREFINIHTVTPIPCCPQHILGDMNLRGEIMTLIDIGPTLSMSRTEAQTAEKAIVVEVDDVMAGITVDEVFDVMYLPPSEIAGLPAAMPTHVQKFFQGTAFYQNQTLSILDLPKLIAKGGLMVNQSV